MSHRNAGACRVNAPAYAWCETHNQNSMTCQWEAKKRSPWISVELYRRTLAERGGDQALGDLLIAYERDTQKLTDVTRERDAMKAAIEKVAWASWEDMEQIRNYAKSYLLTRFNRDATSVNPDASANELGKKP